MGFDNGDYIVDELILKHWEFMKLISEARARYSICFSTFNWIVLLTMAHGPTLAFLGYHSQEVIVVPLTQDTLYSNEHSEVLVKVS